VIYVTIWDGSSKTAVFEPAIGLREVYPVLKIEKVRSPVIRKLPEHRRKNSLPKWKAIFVSKIAL
jgi:hypothetical protein